MRVRLNGRMIKVRQSFWPHDPRPIPNNLHGVMFHKKWGFGVAADPSKQYYLNVFCWNDSVYVTIAGVCVGKFLELGQDGKTVSVDLLPVGDSYFRRLAKKLNYAFKTVGE